jgi:phosphatidylserine/phosphatidylglycerophosphate/cardiolipin synthase-like enzyme
MIGNSSTAQQLNSSTAQRLDRSAMKWITILGAGFFLLLYLDAGFSQSPFSPLASVQARVAFSPKGGAEKLICETLSQATNRIDIAMFFISSEEIIKTLCVLSSERGIAIRFLTDSGMQSAGNRPHLERLDKAGIQIYVAPYKLHHKCAIVDEKMVLSGAANWSENADTSNHEDSIALAAPELAQKYTKRFGELIHTSKALNPLAALRPSASRGQRPFSAVAASSREQPIPVDSAAVYFTPHPSFQSDLLAAIHSAKKIDLAFYLLQEPGLIDALIARAKGGIPIRLFTDSVMLIGKSVIQLQQLWDAGIPIYVFHGGHHASMHLKTAIFDDRYLWTGSANWTPGAFSQNAEDTICLDSPALAKLYAQKLDSLVPLCRSFAEQALQLPSRSASPAISAAGTQPTNAAAFLPPTGPRDNFTIPNPIPWRPLSTRAAIKYLPDEEMLPSLLKLIKGAKQSIFIMMYSFPETASSPAGNSVIQALEAAAKRGVYVYFLLHNPPSTADRLAAEHSNRVEALRAKGIDARLALPDNALHAVNARNV